MELPAHLDVAAAWPEIRSHLRRTLGDTQYRLWIEPVSVESLEHDTLVLRSPPQTAAWLRKRYGRALERAVGAVLGTGVTVTFAGDSPRGGRGTTEPAGSAEPAGLVDPGPGLNPRYTFEQFIIGESNHLAHAAALAVAENPGQAYNPFFLHAPPGLGKTHLLHAIGNFVLAFGGGTRVRYATGEAFTNAFLSALTTRGQIERFKRAYRDTDVLLIDDVQFLASKAKTEEEFFHTFNALYENGRQLVITCDRLPSQLEGLADRLRERFEAGLVAEISPPNFSTRVAILRKRAALDGVPIAEPGVLELIAERVADSVRGLEGVLIHVVAYHSLTGQPIDLALTERVLGAMRYPERAAPPVEPTSIAHVQRTVAGHYGVTVDELLSSKRTARVALARHVAIHLARELTGAPLAAIGAAFGRDHATVVHACRRVRERALDDQQLAVDIHELAERLRDSPC